MTILPFENTFPQVDPSVYIAPGAFVIGDVHLGKDSSVWFNTVIRGDVNYIRIGERTNIQDLTMIHVDSVTFPTLIGDDVTVGHKAIIHACTIGHRCLIGMGATIMDGVQIGDDCLIGAGSLLTPGTQIPSGSLVKGAPARVSRPIKDTERQWISASSVHYAELARRHQLT